MTWPRGAVDQPTISERIRLTPDSIHLLSACEDCTLSINSSAQRYSIATFSRSTDTHHYISSAPLDIERIARGARGHWGVESVHWLLDVEFKDDLSRYRTGHGAKNMTIVRRFALGLVRANKAKGSVKTRRKTAGWSSDFHHPQQPTFIRCQHQWRSGKYEVYLHVLKLGSADSEAKLAKVLRGTACHRARRSFQLDLLDTTLVARTVEDRGRQWNAEKPYRS